MIAVEALLLAAVWYAVLVKGKVYVSRWDSVIRAIENADATRADNEPQISHKLLRLYNEAKLAESKPRFRLFDWSTTRLLRYAVISVIVFWIVTIIFASFGGFDTPRPVGVTSDGAVAESSQALTMTRVPPDVRTNTRDQE